MARKSITLCGITFENDGKCDKVRVIPGSYNWDEINSVYARPSQSKVYIWHTWCEWVDEMSKKGYDVSIKISSHNCMFFSISGSIVFSDGRKAAIWITHAHNRIYFESED